MNRNGPNPLAGLKRIKITTPLILLVLVGAIFLGYTYLSTRPDVLSAKAGWAQSEAVLNQSKGPLYEELAKLLPAATNLALVILGGGTVFIIVLAFSISLLLHNTSRFLARGLEYVKEENGQRTRISLVQPMAPQLASGNTGGHTRVEPPNRQQLGGHDRHGQLPQNQATMNRIGPGERRSGYQPGVQGLPNPQPKPLSRKDPLDIEAERVLGE